MFDTVAALGARGMRRFLIHVGLTAGIGLVAALLSIVPAAVLSALADRFLGFGFGWLDDVRAHRARHRRGHCVVVEAKGRQDPGLPAAG